MKNLAASIGFVVAIIISQAAVASPASGIGTVSVNIAQPVAYHSAYTIDNKKKVAIEQTIFESMRIKKVLNQLGQNLNKQFGKILSTSSSKK